MVQVSKTSGFVISYYSNPNVVTVHTLNGTLLGQVGTGEIGMRAMKIIVTLRNDKEYLILGGDGGVYVRALPYLDLVHVYNMAATPLVMSLAVVDELFIFAGLDNGEVALLPWYLDSF